AHEPSLVPCSAPRRLRVAVGSVRPEPGHGQVGHRRGHDHPRGRHTPPLHPRRHERDHERSQRLLRPGGEAVQRLARGGTGGRSGVRHGVHRSIRARARLRLDPGARGEPTARRARLRLRALHPARRHGEGRRLPGGRGGGARRHARDVGRVPGGGMRSLKGLALCLSLCAASAGAVEYEARIQIGDEDDLYELLATEDITQQTFDTLVELLRDKVDLCTDGTDELYSLPNLNYDDVAAILAYRKEAGSIPDPQALVAAGVIDDWKVDGIS